ncbi:ribosomal-protein-alanine N-acetyltransferase [Actinomadura sp. NEAU-AAG5]|uniref:[Ribosomal protein bS18]-alanine N-acetyltransferase n=2 Tax=Actinomadura litoris TaxID=2678616 RepID=A0A7K1L7Z1_9ACTN|nr:ribosomal protein S18-alanine N-acetyltransferase [Actinomadura litoris]MBT2210445.1 ribosomal protein S18-alanine N-acetyltransferase [Actinomadura sp. NEAU-AAG7]MUN40564.1 ribosomal-protein-alanine N-acetyltransferase [Actinomadura litoris]
MTGADLPSVHALESVLFPEDAWSEGMLRDELAEQPRTRHYVVAEETGGEIVGYAGLAVAGGQADVQTIGVRADRRGGGIGGALLTALIDEAVRRESEAVFLEVRADNDGARRLYERFGFGRVGVRRRYYQPANVDAIVMRRVLHRRPVGFSREM